MDRKRPLRIIATCLLFLAPLTPLIGQGGPDRVAMLTEALRARSAGDLATAETILSDLTDLAPADTNIRALLESVRADRAGRERGEPTRFEPVAAGDPGAPAFGTNVDFDELVQRESERLRARAKEAKAPRPTPPPRRQQRRDTAGLPPIEEVSPAFVHSQEQIADLLLRGRAQFIAGDYDGARETYAQVEARDPNNAEAKYFQAQIASRVREAGDLDRHKTREQMMEEVSRGWQRPQVFDRDFTARAVVEDRGLREKLQEIVLPRVSFAGVPLSRVIDTLSALSEDYDPENAGVNMVLIDPGGVDPRVSITLRNLALNRVLDFIVESVGFEYDVQSDAVVVRQGMGPGTRLETDFFPISRSTIIRLTGFGAGTGTATPPGPLDPFAPPPAPAPAATVGEEETALRNFLQRAGVPFDTIEGANLALADGQLIVTQTPRNMERVRNILRRYTEVKQVEIEARFLEVQQGDLEELGFNWSVAMGGHPLVDPQTGNPVIGPDGRPLRGHRRHFNTQGRRLGDPFTVAGLENPLSIVLPGTPGQEGQPGIPGDEIRVPQGAPVIPNNLDLGAGAGDFARISGVIGTADIDLVIRALERKTGNDLMSAPKVTVLSGKTAEITVAQELLYPSSYDRVEAQVGRGDSSSGSAGVAITAGTPQNFRVRNVGVEMEVTPTVEDDNAISLLLEPRVTEFEGFVEYGGTSVAIASNTTVTVPSGFYQPIFSVRRVRTEVTIWDGATVVMGGLTREQAVSVYDKVPVLGDIPLLGRLFRSQGESTQKRNLLIFVTANLISPGGSPARQQISSVDPGSLFQNPTIVTPGGAVNRGVRENE